LAFLDQPTLKMGVSSGAPIPFHSLRGPASFLFFSPELTPPLHEVLLYASFFEDTEPFIVVIFCGFDSPGGPVLLTVNKFQ